MTPATFFQQKEKVRAIRGGCKQGAKYAEIYSGFRIVDFTHWSNEMQYDSVSKRHSVQYPTSSEEPWKMRMEKKTKNPKQNKKTTKTQHVIH